MTSSLILIIFLLAAVLLWLDGARARELAVGIGKHACRVRGLQFLDETVFMERIGLRWTPGGLRFRRMFRFEYSVEGVARHAAYVLLIGSELEALHIQGNSTIDQQATPEDSPQGGTDSERPADNVIPFRDRKH